KRVSNTEATLTIHADSIEQKAEKSELLNYVDKQEYSNKVGSLETSIDNITGRVEETEGTLDKVTGDIVEVSEKYAQLEIRADGIESEVSRVEEDVNGKITSANTQIQQNADSIRNKVDTLDYNRDKDGIISDITANRTEISQLSDEIELRVTKEEFENHEIVGRNLIRNSCNFSDMTGWGRGTIVTKDGYKAIEVSSGTLSGAQNGAILEPDTYYVYSGWLMSSQDYNSDNIGFGNPLHYQVQYDGSNSAGYVSRRVLSKPEGIIPSETWFKISILIKTRVDNPNGELKFNPFIYENTSDAITSNKYWARDFYLTKGEKQLEDWTPAPEDALERITKAE